MKPGNDTPRCRCDFHGRSFLHLVFLLSSLPPSRFLTALAIRSRERARRRSLSFFLWRAATPATRTRTNDECTYVDTYAHTCVRTTEAHTRANTRFGRRIRTGCPRAQHTRAHTYSRHHPLLSLRRRTTDDHERALSRHLSATALRAGHTIFSSFVAYSLQFYVPFTRQRVGCVRSTMWRSRYYRCRC